MSALSLSRPAEAPPPAAVVIVIVLGTISVIAGLSAFGSGEATYRGLGWLAFLAWWLILGVPLLTSTWAIRSPLKTKSTRSITTIVLVVLTIIGGLLLVAAAAMSLGAAYNVSLGWNQPYITNVLVARNVATFLLPPLWVATILGVSVMKILRKNWSSPERLRRALGLILVCAAALYAFELIPLLFAIP